MKKLILISMALLVVTSCQEKAPSEETAPEVLAAGTNEDPKPADVTITLTVEASELYEIPNPTQEDIMKYCGLYDSNKPNQIISGNLLREFETKVKRKNTIEWDGINKSTNSNYNVEIESIVYALGKEISIDKSEKVNCFNSVTLCSNNGRTVRGEVKDNIPEVADTDLYHIYWLNFRITNTKEKKVTKIYSIDPRLKIE